MKEPRFPIHWGSLTTHTHRHTPAFILRMKVISQRRCCLTPQGLCTSRSLCPERSLPLLSQSLPLFKIQLGILSPRNNFLTSELGWGLPSAPALVTLCGDTPTSPTKRDALGVEPHLLDLQPHRSSCLEQSRRWIKTN